MYFGSVRFFKHLILLAITVTILSLLFGLFWLSGSLGRVYQENQRLASQLTELQKAGAGLSPLSGSKDPELPSPADSPDNPPLPAAPAQVPLPTLPYQAMYPALYSGVDIAFEDTTGKVMYLTFDDGPTELTPKILDVLNRHNIKGTFFVIGKNIKGNGKILRRIIDEGHFLGLHSYSHEYQEIYLTVEAFLEDFDKAYTAFKEETGVTPVIFRFPGGSINGYNSDTFQAIIAEMLRRGFLYYDWNISAGDATGASSAASVKANIRSDYADYTRGIVLLHEKKQTVNALDDVILELKSSGYCFEPLTNKVRPVIFAYPR